MVEKRDVNYSLFLTIGTINQSTMPAVKQRTEKYSIFIRLCFIIPTIVNQRQFANVISRRREDILILHSPGTTDSLT